MARIKLLAASVALVVALAGGTLAAYAGWCWSDPVIGFKAPGMREADVRIDVAVPDQNKLQVSKVLITIRHPWNVVPRVKLMDNILPEQVIFIPTSEAWRAGQTVKVGVDVVVLAPTMFDMQYIIQHTKQGGAVETIFKSGKSNEKVSDEFGLFVRK